jgi:hypothetical protein
LSIDCFLLLLRVSKWWSAVLFGVRHNIVCCYDHFFSVVYQCGLHHYTYTLGRKTHNNPLGNLCQGQKYRVSHYLPNLAVL